MASLEVILTIPLPLGPTRQGGKEGSFCQPSGHCVLAASTPFVLRHLQDNPPPRGTCPILQRQKQRHPLSTSLFPLRPPKLSLC